MSITLSIIIPFYNEASTILQTLQLAQQAPLPPQVDREIIAVDDGSTDGASSNIKQNLYPSLILLHHKKNLGKGAAIQTALKKVSGDIVIIQDADLEYDPNEYSKLIGPILEGKAEAVYGSRFVTSDYRRVHLFRHYLGNRFLTLVSNLFSNYNLTDMETGFKAFKTSLIKSINLKEKRFGFEPEVTQKIARKNARLYEVGISYHGRDFDEGKKIRPFKDGLKALFCIIRYSLFG